MSGSSLLVTQRTPSIQQGILDFYLKKANKFRAYFPEGEELGGSKQDFLALEGLSVQPWSGMVGCISVEGNLTSAVLSLLWERGLLLEDESYHPLRLWSYELFDESEMLLRVEDFSVWIICATPSELQSLEKQGISVNEWQEVTGEPEEGVMPLPMDETFLKQITQVIKESFLPPNP